MSAWLFQYRVDIVDSIEENSFSDPPPIGSLIWWRATRWADKMTRGDLVFFWQTSRIGGLHGWGTIVGDPTVASRSQHPIVKVRVEYWSAPPLLKSRDFVDEWNLWHRLPRGTNFTLADIEVERLLQLLLSEHPQLEKKVDHLRRGSLPKRSPIESDSTTPEDKHSSEPDHANINSKSSHNFDIAGDDESLIHSYKTTFDFGQEKPVTAKDNAKKLTVWYATNRMPDVALGKFFSGARSDSGTVHYGKCVVNVPTGHKFGSTGSGWWNRLLRGDDRLKVEGIEKLLSAAYFEQLRTHISEACSEDFAILFVHGYRVSFVDAAIRTAQLAYDLRAHTASFFSWPSAGDAAAYTIDEASVSASTLALQVYLQSLDEASGDSGQRLHLIAHSMGNRVLLSALHNLALVGWKPKALDKIVFAAPDEDRDLFMQTMAALQAIGNGRTLYASDKDKAVAASEILHGYARAGYFPPITVSKGLDTVDASNVDSTFLGHSDFATERSLLNDIFLWLTYGTPPVKRPSLLQATTDDGSPYWQLT